MPYTTFKYPTVSKSHALAEILLRPDLTTIDGCAVGCENGAVRAFVVANVPTGVAKSAGTTQVQASQENGRKRWGRGEEVHGEHVGWTVVKSLGPELEQS